MGGMSRGEGGPVEGALGYRGSLPACRHKYSCHANVYRGFLDLGRVLREIGAASGREGQSRRISADLGWRL